MITLCAIGIFLAGVLVGYVIAAFGPGEAP